MDDRDRPLTPEEQEAFNKRVEEWKKSREEFERWLADHEAESKRIDAEIAYLEYYLTVDVKKGEA